MEMAPPLSAREIERCLRKRRQGAIFWREKEGDGEKEKAPCE